MCTGGFDLQSSFSTSLLVRILWDYPFWKNMKWNLQFSDLIHFQYIVQEIRSEGRVCQAAETPNENMKSPLHLNPVSTCVDIFHMPRTSWNKQIYDQLFFKTDIYFYIQARVVGMFTSYQETLLINGVRALFVPGWGLGQSFLHTRRPQANGRAETAGNSMLELKKQQS